ncbi:hypothetical protein FFK22_028570 [Mycobacterium sp. KBS0706]|uniref:DarT1-associated NADAR antitoxin family protein n=1 Tax=Mycobacterium sp. KBS0706 TaxID=2578109 RepID=UPI00110F7E06|nr:hypothetical protein [Mycobacterium sp. KBS0706]TSD85191.1 hypothetical protein FFK22_028570 [Mycobacterium sp. KBS0706]
MAERPVFVPLKSGRRLVSEVSIAFRWQPGMAPSQKRKNISALHQAASDRGLQYILEISSKSEREIGRRLSAFHQKIEVSGYLVSLESAFQGSKVFEKGGPFTDIFHLDPRSAKRDLRLRESGKLLHFSFEEEIFPLTPPTIFYDWLYINAIYPERNWLRRLSKIDGFTDIEFNPEKSVNCQARSCALFVSLESRGLLDEAITSFESFKDILTASDL